MIDILIPLHVKDIPSLDIERIKNNVIDEIENIYIVSIPDERILNICKEQNLIWINEPQYDLSRIREDKRGWLLQQLIKLQGDITKNENFLVIDADVHLKRKFQFLDNNIPIFYRWPHKVSESYFKMNELLVGIYKNDGMTYVTDKMLFNKSQLKRIHNIIEERMKCPWYEAIINNFDNGVDWAFSEFELYGLLVDGIIKIQDYKSQINEYRTC